MKRLTAIALVTALALVAAGCGSKKSSSGSTTTTQAPSFKVGLSTDTGGLNDRSFNHLAYVGLQRAQAQLGVQTPRRHGGVVVRLHPEPHRARDARATTS